MFSSNTYKVLFLLFIAILLTASCKFWQSNSEKNNFQTSDSEIQTNIPFSNKEPEIFQAEFIISSFVNGKKTEQKNFVAKKGGRFLATYRMKSSNKISYLFISEDKTYYINHDKKTFQKRGFSASNKDLPQISWRDFLTTKWLNEKTSSKFEKVESEDNLTKYLVKMDGSENSEVLVFIDEKIPFPVKQEFYSISNGEKVLTTLVEVKNYKTEVEDSLFKVPKDYKEIN